MGGNRNLNKQELKPVILPVAQIVLNNSRRWIKETITRNNFLGFDTETYKGKCKLLANSDGMYVYNPTFDDCIELLWYKASQSYYRSFWNIDFDISAILKLWNDLEKIDDLIHGIPVQYKDYLFLYLRPKMFKISKGHKSIFFTDLFNIFKLSLNKASEAYLKDSKIDTIDGNLLNTDLTYWIKNLKDIIKYCIKDCKLTADLGNFILNQTLDAGLPTPRFFTSHASFSKQYFRLKAQIPSIKYIPLNILDIAYSTYYGGRFEIFKRGYFDDLYCYDINSAYPYSIKHLPSFKYGTWEKVDTASKSEIFGFYKVLLDIPQAYISAFPIKHKGLVIFPSGIFETWITWYELDLLKEFVVIFHYGYEYYETKREYYPFYKHIELLFKKKAENKNSNEVFYMLYKIVMNALYGCFIERHKRPDGITYAGILFNPVYATNITAHTRWQLLKEVKKKDWKHIIAFHTDSIITDKPLNYLNISDKIGAWNLEYNDAGVILMTGVYQIGSKVRRRGFSSKDMDWFELLKKNGHNDKIVIPKIHVVKVAEALRRWHSLDKVNIFIQEYKKLNINSDKKRNWNRDFVDCNDVLNSNISSKTLQFKYFNKKELY